MIICPRQKILLDDEQSEAPAIAAVIVRSVHCHQKLGYSLTTTYEGVLSHKVEV